MASTDGYTQTYKMTSMDNDLNQHFQDAIDVIQQHSNNSYYDSDYSYYETPVPQQPSLQCQDSCCLIIRQSEVPAPVCNWNDTPNESSRFYPILPPQRNSKGRKKLRLYEYLHEALNDPNMGDSIQWTDSGSGTFHFVSKNKEKLAECWGQRKGNRKTMTYQKMARALRNYSRTGEIVKVRRKLTYQFNPDILHRLGSTQVTMHLPCRPALEEVHTQQQSPAEQNCGGFAAVDWHSWYEHYQVQEDYDLAQSFTSHSSAKL